MTSGADDRHARVPLRTLLGDYPTTHALRAGVLASPLAPLTFADVAVPNKAFKRVVRDLGFDVAELALMTFLMARSRDIPLRLLPVVVFGRSPLPHLVCDRERRAVTPAGLRGCRIGVRACTTTAVWIRALLADEGGVDCDAIDCPSSSVILAIRRRRFAAGSSDTALESSITSSFSARHSRRTRRSCASCSGSFAKAGMPAAPRSTAPRRRLDWTRIAAISRLRPPVAAAQRLLARPLVVDDLITGAMAALR